MTPAPTERVTAALERGGLCAPGESVRGWTAQCPAHDDRNASLSLGAGDDERALLHCHAGCSTEEIVAALGLELRDLFACDSPTASNGPKQIIPTYNYVGEAAQLIN